MCYGAPLLSEPTSASDHSCRVGIRERQILLQEFRTNSEYLLQSCLKYDWKNVERICLVLVNYFERQRHQETSKAQLMSVDPWGNTPLHAACYFRPTPIIVKLLLKAASLYEVPLSNITNYKGATPLVIVCSAGSTTQVIYQLLESDSDMVSCVDSDATTPFVALARRYQMLRRIPKYSKMTVPLEDVTKEMMRMEEESTEYYETYSSGRGGDADEDCDENDFYNYDGQKIFHTLWKKMDAIIQAKWFADTRNHHKSWPLRKSFHSILHRAAYVSDLLPPVMLSLMVRCHEEMVSLESHGILPLHLAVTVDTISYNPTLLMQRSFFLQKILKANPRTATVAIPCSGRLPLTEAIASGLPWNLEAAEGHRASNEEDRASTDNINMDNNYYGGETIQGPLQSLRDAAPDVMDQNDPVTGLRPFMLAATVQQTNPKKEGSIADVLQLDTIYALLMLDPSSIRCD
jgi:hypothetical protein